MALNNGLHSLNVDEIDPYDHGRDVVHVVRTGCNFVGLPMFLLDLNRVDNLTDPLCPLYVLRDAAPLADHNPDVPLRLWIVDRRGVPLCRRRDDALVIVAMVLHEMAS